MIFFQIWGIAFVLLLAAFFFMHEDGGLVFIPGTFGLAAFKGIIDGPNMGILDPIIWILCVGVAGWLTFWLITCVFFDNRP